MNYDELEPIDLEIARQIAAEGERTLVQEDVFFVAKVRKLLATAAQESGQGTASGPEAPSKPGAEALAALMANHGNAEDRYVADAEHLNCPACGGSGHVDDAAAYRAAAGAILSLKA